MVDVPGEASRSVRNADRVHHIKEHALLHEWADTTGQDAPEDELRRVHRRCAAVAVGPLKVLRGGEAVFCHVKLARGHAAKLAHDEIGVVGKLHGLVGNDRHASFDGGVLAHGICHIIRPSSIAGERIGMCRKKLVEVLDLTRGIAGVCPGEDLCLVIVVAGGCRPQIRIKLERLAASVFEVGRKRCACGGRREPLCALVEVPRPALFPSPAWHEASLLFGKDGVLKKCLEVLFAIGAKIQPAILTARFAGYCSNCGACKQTNVSLPSVLFAASAEASALKPVPKRIMDRPEKIIRGYGTQNTRLIRPPESGIGKHRIIIHSRPSDAIGAVSIICSVNRHSLVGAKITHGVPRVATVGVAVRIKECKHITVIGKRVVLRLGLPDEVCISLLHRRVLRGVRHLIVGVGNAAGQYLVDLNVFALTLEVYSALSGVFFCDRDKPWVRAKLACTLRRTIKRRKVSA